MKDSFIEQMYAYTDKHVHDPQPGDHFTEMLGSAAFIEARNGNEITLRRTNIAGGHKGWGPPEHWTVARFIEWASYGTIPGYWLELYPPRWPDELAAGG